MDIAEIREDFPSLKETVNGLPIIYFDNACMTLKPHPVIDAVQEYYHKYPVCGGRSIYRWGNMVTEKVQESREKLTSFINAAMPEEIIFTKNTTEAINLVARSIGLEKEDAVITTDREHNSNLVPWHMMRDLVGCGHIPSPSREDGSFDLEAFKSIMEKNRVKLVSMVHTSNLDGYTLPAREIIEIAHDADALVMLDGAQSVPHKPMDVQELDVDFLGFSIHKMVGPTGVGVLYGKYELLERMAPFIGGGDTVELTTLEDTKFLPPPHKFEAGLQNYAGIIGAGAAVDYLSEIGMENILDHEHILNEYLTNALSNIQGLQIIGPRDPKLRSGIVSFIIEGISPHDISMTLDEGYNIMIRSGTHCVHSWFDSTGIDGSARASLYLYNTVEEARTFVDALMEFTDSISGGGGKDN